MKSAKLIFFVFISIISGCGPVTIKPAEPGKQLKSDSVQADSLQAGTAATDTISKSKIHAFGDLYFGMKKAEVERLNEPRQQLGKNEYSFDYLFDGDSMLYKVNIRSAGVKVIGYDSSLKAYYNNLYNILQTRYGEPETHTGFPSVFDVQNAGKYKIDFWEEEGKIVEILLRMNALNSYSAVCEITAKEMEQAELKRQKNIKNKDVIDAANKF